MTTDQGPFRKVHKRDGCPAHGILCCSFMIRVTGEKMLLNETELLLQAKKYDMVDETVLRSKI